MADELPCEKAALAALRRLAGSWPKTLWLWSASGTLCVMRTLPDGSRAMLDNGGVDPAYTVETIDIPNDGGDW